MIFAVDFDNVLMDPHNRVPGYKMGRPIPGAVAALRAMRERGDTIIIHTVRANTGPASCWHVEEWLNHFQVPFDRVTAIKPNADAYIDDKAVPFTDWDQVQLELENIRRNNTVKRGNP